MQALGRDVTLADGTKVHVRLLHADDESLLHDAFARMSERSVYFRFLSPLKRLPDEVAHNLASVDGEQRLAISALAGERIAGVARYDRVPGTAIAEVAIAVVDEFQRRGLGSLLLTALARIGAEHGIEKFTLIVLPENQSMLGLLRRLKWIHQARLSGGVYEITFRVPPAG